LPGGPRSYRQGVPAFFPLTQPAAESIDLRVVRQAGGEFATYIDSDSDSPFIVAVRGALEAPLDVSQILNASIALANVVALLALSLARDESEVPELINGSLSRSAAVAFPELYPAGEPQTRAQARALVCRVFGGARPEELPVELDGHTLVAIAALGDAGIMMSDRVGLPRPVLAAAIGQAAEAM
ncbi:MAG: hypothetical protein WCI74_12715, partial [Actinomycetes bacterium]